MLFDLPRVENFYRPEIAVVPYRAWLPTRGLPATEAWSVVPDLVVEVVGRNRTTGDVIDRVDEYLRAGVRTVWVVQTVDA